MQEKTIQIGNSPVYNKLDEEFSEIEEELEKKLWELYDRMINQKNSWKRFIIANFAKSFYNMI